MKTLYFILVILCFVGCTSSVITEQKKLIQAKDSLLTKKDSSLKAIDSSQQIVPSHDLIEEFTDSTNIGLKGRNKISLFLYRTIDSSYVSLKFFSLRNGRWVLKNNLTQLKDGALGLDPQLSDFNNDGLNDITYVCEAPARGANEVRQLLIYSKQEDKLVNIRNSPNYPNLRYNKELNCLDAFRVYG